MCSAGLRDGKKRSIALARSAPVRRIYISSTHQMLPTRLEYLVFAGGGMRGLSYAGALEQLAKQGQDF